MTASRLGTLAAVAVLLLGTASCAKNGAGSTANETPEEPPATARDGAPVFQVPADVEAVIGKARLRVVDSDEPRLMRLRAHLDVMINGHEVKVPAGIGIVDDKRSSALTTTDATGVLHVAAPRKDETFRLGQLFQQWNVPLDKNCIAGFCVSENADKQLLAFVNGELAVDPSTIQLTDRSEIVVWYGDRSGNPTVPTAYDFSG